MKRKVCLFLDYLSAIPRDQKSDILSGFDVEAYELPQVVESEKMRDEGRNELSEPYSKAIREIDLFGYRDAVVELRRAFALNTSNVLNSFFAGGEINNWSRFLSPKSFELLYSISRREEDRRQISQWALNRDNWFVVDSNTPSFELQSQISSQFPALVFDNVPIECSSRADPETLVANLDEVMQSSAIFQLWENGNFGNGSEILLLDTGVSNSIAMKYQIARQAVGTFNSADGDGHGSAMADVIMSIAPAAKITSVKILNSYSDGDIINFIAGLTTILGKGSVLANLAIGLSPGYLRSMGPTAASLKEAIVNMVNACASNRNFLLCAAGNDSANQLRWPAAAENVLAVGSHNRAFQLSSFSNYAQSPNFVLTAGGDVRQLDKKVEGFGRYGLGLSRDVYGTSFSTAVATGISGLLLRYDWFRHMQTSSKISLFQNHCRKNESGFPILNIADIGAIWPI